MSSAAATAEEPAFAELDPVFPDLVFPDRGRPAGHALADLLLQLLMAQAERGGAAVLQGRGPRLDRVSLVGTFDLEEIAADLDTFFD